MLTPFWPLASSRPRLVGSLREAAKGNELQYPEHGYGAGKLLAAPFIFKILLPGGGL